MTQDERTGARAPVHTAKKEESKLPAKEVFQAPFTYTYIWLPTALTVDTYPTLPTTRDRMVALRGSPVVWWNGKPFAPIAVMLAAGAGERASDEEYARIMAESPRNPQEVLARSYNAQNRDAPVRVVESVYRGDVKDGKFSASDPDFGFLLPLFDTSNFAYIDGDVVLRQRAKWSFQPFRASIPVLLGPYATVELPLPPSRAESGDLGANPYDESETSSTSTTTGTDSYTAN